MNENSCDIGTRCKNHRICIPSRPYCCPENQCSANADCSDSVTTTTISCGGTTCKQPNSLCCDQTSAKPFCASSALSCNLSRPQKCGSNICSSSTPYCCSNGSNRVCVADERSCAVTITKLDETHRDIVGSNSTLFDERMATALTVSSNSVSTAVSQSASTEATRATTRTVSSATKALNLVKPATSTAELNKLPIAATQQTATSTEKHTTVVNKEIAPPLRTTTLLGKIDISTSTTNVSKGSVDTLNLTIASKPNSAPGVETKSTDATFTYEPLVAGRSTSNMIIKKSTLNVGNYSTKSFDKNNIRAETTTQKTTKKNSTKIIKDDKHFIENYNLATVKPSAKTKEEETQKSEVFHPDRVEKTARKYFPTKQTKSGKAFTETYDSTTVKPSKKNNEKETAKSEVSRPDSMEKTAKKYLPTKETKSSKVFTEKYDSTTVKFSEKNNEKETEKSEVLDPNSSGGYACGLVKCSFSEPICCGTGSSTYCSKTSCASKATVVEDIR